MLVGVDGVMRSGTEGLNSKSLTRRLRMIGSPAFPDPVPAA